jgi:hypothetical protein
LSVDDQAQGRTYLILMQEDLNNIALALDNIGCS